MITCTNIGYGNQLGAQMTNFADLYYLARENNQELKLLGELEKYRRGYQFVEVFDFPEKFILKARTGIGGGNLQCLVFTQIWELEKKL